MIERLAGVRLDDDDAQYIAGALDYLLSLLRMQSGKTPTARLEAVVARLRKTDAKTDVSGRDTSADVRKLGTQVDSMHHAWYVVIDTIEAAKILGVSPAGARDLARRGKLRARNANGRWLFDAASVVERAEKRR